MQRIFFIAFTILVLLIFSDVHSTDITIDIKTPADKELVGDTLNIVVKVTSVYQLQNVKAVIEGRETSLVFTDNAYCQLMHCYPGWVGSISMVGLSRGQKTLTVMATDVFNLSAQMDRSFIYDQKPQLTVYAPLSESVARPNLFIKAKCTDDNQTGCVSIKAKAGISEYDFPDEVAAGTDSIETTVSLASYDGKKVFLKFEAQDSAGQYSSEIRTVYVESSNRLIEIETTAGRIWDVQPDRILFLEVSGNTNLLKILQRTSGQETIVMGESGKVPLYGFLTPNGAIFVEKSNNATNSVLYEWRNGELLNLGYITYESLKVKGGYAIWNSSLTDQLNVRDLLSATNTVIPHPFGTYGTGNWMNDVAENGDVVYWSNEYAYNIFRYRKEVITQLTNDKYDSGIWNTYPLTDGINVVYRKHTPCCSNQTYSIAMYGASGEEILAPARTQEPSPGQDYQVNNGWTAFTKSGTAGELQVWLRSPSGEQQQITHFGSSSRINALGPNGDVTFTNGNRLYLGRPDSKPIIDIGSSLGRSLWEDNQWLVIIGRSLFKVDTAIHPDISANPSLVNFGNVNVGLTSEQTLTITNTGNVILNTGQIIALLEPFEIITDNCSNKVLTPNYSCTIKLRFSPQASMQYNVSLDLPYKDPEDKQYSLTVSLSGTGSAVTGPDISIDRQDINFGNINIGVTASTDLIVRNDGNGNLQITNISISGTNASEFNQTNNCTSPVAPQSTCTLTVRFIPTSEGLKSATLSIYSNDLDENPFVVLLKGTGIKSTDGVGTGMQWNISGGGGCFIATAAYGSYLDPHVQVLREFRDKYLLANFKMQISNFKIEFPNLQGKAFVAFYYKLSPPLANYIRQHEALRIVTRWLITPAVYMIKYPLSLVLILLVVPLAMLYTTS
ncbi:MAG: choice-of-anchor D domain-containing protein [Nitrospira sp.]|nr:choice-of-anchor D domain-containing protein [Nitrospira sp.]